MKRSSYCTFYIVRHGETEWNVNKQLQGQQDSPLTEKGIRQAEDLKRELHHILFDEVFSSDLLRAKRTAEIISLEQKLAVKTSQLLRERSFGKYEGRNAYENDIRQIFDWYHKLSDSERWNFKHPEIENDNTLMTRFITFLREIAIINPGKTILVVTHGGIMRALLIHLGFATYDQLRSNSVGNCSYIKLESDGTDFFIKETSNISKKLNAH